VRAGLLGPEIKLGFEQAVVMMTAGCDHIHYAIAWQDTEIWRETGV
jgi:hypothetical protein